MTPAQADRDREKARLTRIAMIADRCNGDRWEIDADGKQRHVVATRSTGDRVILCTIYEDALPDEIDLISGALSDAILFLSLRRRAIASGATLFGAISNPWSFGSLVFILVAAGVLSWLIGSGRITINRSKTT